jgi:hypothetical protein
MVSPFGEVKSQKSKVKNPKRHDSLKYTLVKLSWGISNIRKIPDWDFR